MEEKSKVKTIPVEFEVWESVYDWDNQAEMYYHIATCKNKEGQKK